MNHIWQYCTTLLDYNAHLKMYTLRDIQKHNSENDCWIIVNGIVYDVTNFINLHPAGKECLLKRAGTDCTRDLGFHSGRAIKILQSMCIGKLIG